MEYKLKPCPEGHPVELNRWLGDSYNIVCTVCDFEADELWPSESQAVQAWNGT